MRREWRNAHLFNQVVNMERWLKVAYDCNVEHQSKALNEEHRANKADMLAEEYRVSYEGVMKQLLLG